MSAGSDGGTEREIKIPAPDLGAVRSRLSELAARLEAPRAFERNRVFDRADGERSLLVSGRLLRLREDATGSRLTYKGVARFEGGTKIREEREVVIDSADTAGRILEGIGFEAVRRYEKWRETWRIGGCLVVLDETPIGCWVEIEEAPLTAHRRDRCASRDRGGDEHVDASVDLAETARLLGLDPRSAEPRSYLALYEAWREQHPEAPADMVFSTAGEGPGG